MRFTSALIGALAASAAAVSTPSTHVLHEKRDAPLKRWTKVRSVEQDSLMPIRIGLQQSNLEHGPRLLDEVSRHDSPRFGKWFTADEIVDMFAPSQDRVDAVTAWLQDAGVAAHRISQSANKQWIQFDAEAKEAEKLFKTKYHVYQHSNGNTNIACDEYHLPSHITEHVDYVTPGLKLIAGGKVNSPDAKRKRGAAKTSPLAGPIPIPGTPKVDNSSTNAQLANCANIITPPCIAAMYNITKGTKANPNNALGIFEEGDFYSATDLLLFLSTFGNGVPPTTEPALKGIDGGFAPGVIATGESNLDLMLAYPILNPQNRINLFQTDDFFYATGLLSSSGGGFLNTFLDAIDGSYCTYSAYGETGDASIDPKYPDPNPLGYQGKRQCGVYKPTNVISISYGEQEDDLPTNYQQRQCSEFMKLGMQGTTTVLASGDSGVAARASDDGNADGCLGKGEVFNPDFPASCPYLLAVGATYLPPGASAAADQEVAVTRFPSGGGFSNIYPRPSYQNDAVNTYLTQHNPSYPYYSLTAPTNNPTAAQTNGGRYNRAGRGYPDVSAVGDNVIIFLDGLPTLIGGTSASAPVVASILNRINEERLAVGKSTVGFVNPTLYAHPEVFHDITVGNNSGCGTPGFFTAPGWDPVTGLGTPDYQKLLKVYMSLP